MRYDKFVKTPGSLVPRQSPNDLMSNPGRSQNYDLAESYLVREAGLVRDLVGFFLAGPPAEKAEEYWVFFSRQWKDNIVNYIKNINAVSVVNDAEVEHYKNHYRYRTAIRMAAEYVERIKQIDRIKDAHPNVPPERNRLLFGINRNVANIHSRLMEFHKLMKAQVEDPDTMLRR